jgi:hypothetical protein
MFTFMEFWTALEISIHDSDAFQLLLKTFTQKTVIDG